MCSSPKAVPQGWLFLYPEIHKHWPFFHFLTRKDSPLPSDCARRPLAGAGWLKENHPRFAPVFSFAKPCTIKAKVYFNGILQYAGKEGTPNIEFEAKIIQELIYCANGYGFGGLGAGPTHADDYTRWIMLLCEDGFLDEKFPSLSEVLSTKYAGYGYYNYMEFFKVKDPGYNKGIIYSMQPSLLDYISNNYGI